MTSFLFEKWIKHWDQKLAQTKRKILLFVDNCSAHPKVPLQNIKLAFLPPNTTAASQPMDQGIIRSLKHHYRCALLKERIKAFDANAAFQFDLLGALYRLRKAWAAVTEETIKNCFKKARFVQNTEEPVAVEAENESDEFADLWEEFQEKCDNDGAGLEEYMTVDDLVETAGTLTLTECAESVLDASQESDDQEEIEEEPLPEIPPVTRQQALSAFATFKRYAQVNSADSKVHDMVDKLDDFLDLDGKTKEEQKKITDYFK